jgi:hypothetical protein
MTKTLLSTIFKTTKSLRIIVLGLFLILLSNLLGHYLPPFSIFLTPVLVPTIIAGLNINLYKINFPLTVLYGYALLIGNDLLIRQYAGGAHDNEGDAIIFLASAIGFGLAVLFMFLYSFILVNKAQSTKGWPIVTNLATVIIGGLVIALIYVRLT